MAIPVLPQRLPKGWWVCGCVKRSKSGRLTHLKFHAPERTKCRVCGCTKAESERLAAEGK